MSKKFFAFLLTLILCLFVSACGSNIKISLSEKEITLEVGEEYAINATVSGSDSLLDYVINDDSLLSIEGNVITALKMGTTTVDVVLQSDNNIKETLKVTITGEVGIILNGPEVIYIGGEAQLEAVANGLNEDLLWYSLNENIATVDQNGKVKGIKLGKATIVVECGEYMAEIDIMVKRMPEIVISGESEVVVGGTTTLKASLRNLEGTVNWESSDASVATIDDKGVVTGVKEGKATITASCAEFSKTFEISVVYASIKITGPKVVYIGESIQLSAKVKNVSNANDAVFNWTSNLDSLAVVTGGKVTGVQEGTVVITASWNGLQAEYEIEVVLRREVNIEGSDRVDLNDVIELRVETLNVSGKVEWKSSDESIATADENGVVSGHKIGSVTISATVEGVTGTMNVKVISVTDKVTYYFEGGTSVELYKAEGSKASFELTSYNHNNGSFWSGGYSSNVYITTRDADPGATFSDRIYIGKNEYTGYYEIKSILTSGGSSWAEGAEYVITISTSYSAGSGYRPIHSQVQKLNEGDVVIINTNDIPNIKSGNTTTVSFFKPTLNGNTVAVQKGDFSETLITPVRLGYTFMGWFNANGEKVETLTNDQISGNVKLYAKWDQLNPVTSIKVNEIPSEIEAGETFKINASVVPSDAFFTEVLFYTSDSDIISVTDEGLLKTINAGKVTITLTDYIGEIVNTYEITVNPVASLDIKFPANYTGVLNINDTLQLEPSYVGKTVDNLSYSYSSKDSNIATVDANGLVKAVSGGSTEIAIISSDGKELMIGVTVYGLSEKDKVEQVISLLVDTAIPEVEVGNACLYNDGTTRYYDSSYGSVNYYLFQDFKINNTYQSQFVSTGSHSCTRADSDIEFVTVHDTATLTGTGDSMAKGLSTSTSVSIHYVVGNGEAFACLPEKYIAWHAGDGTGVKFQWLATGIKAEEGAKPEFDMVKDGSTWYFTINGQKTRVVCPISNGARTIQNPSKAHFATLGPTWKIENGEYYMGTPWASFGQNASGVICSHGGNNNSVGIEMCVNTGGDIYESYQVNAQLVADILIRNGLDLTRVHTHNSFDGKNCPQVLRAGNYWAEFMKMVEINYILQKDYSDVKITMKSDDPSIVADNGRVINPPKTATTVGYTITVTAGSTTKTIKLYSVVPGSTSWHKLDGIYPASLIWNKGNFVVNK